MVACVSIIERKDKENWSPLVYKDEYKDATVAPLNDGDKQVGNFAFGGLAVLGAITVAAPILAPVMEIVAPIASKAVFDVSLTAYSAQTAMTTAAVGAAKVVGYAAVQYAVSHPEQSMAFVEGFVEGLSEGVDDWSNWKESAKPDKDYMSFDTYSANKAGLFIGDSIRDQIEKVK